MAFFVYSNHGSCNDGDHTAELLAFESRESAELHVEEVRRSHALWGQVVLIEGTEILREYLD